MLLLAPVAWWNQTDKKLTKFLYILLPKELSAKELWFLGTENNLWAPPFIKEKETEKEYVYISATHIKYAKEDDKGRTF